MLITSGPWVVRLSATSIANESLRKQSAKALVINAIDEEGGPLLRNPLNPDDQKPFDSTCRKLHKFLTS